MNKPYYDIYRTRDDARWDRVGIGFLNKDGSYNMRLSEPIRPEDRLQMRQGRKQEKAKEQGAEAGVA